MSRPDQTQKAIAEKRRKLAPELQRVAETAYLRWRKAMASKGYYLKDHDKKAWILQYADEVKRRIAARV